MGRQRTVNLSFPRHFRRVRNSYFYDHGMRPDGTRYYTGLGNDLAFSQWIVGYLVAYNYYSLDTKAVPLPDLASIRAWMDKYCRDNPLHVVSSGAAALVEDSGGSRALHPWKR